MVTYDTSANAAAKVAYIQQRQLGGAMWWESSGDKAGEGSLINLVSSTRPVRISFVRGERCADSYAS